MGGAVAGVINGVVAGTGAFAAAYETLRGGGQNGDNGRSKKKEKGKAWF
jgi:hypothetical protein